MTRFPVRSAHRSDVQPAMIRLTFLLAVLLVLAGLLAQAGRSGSASGAGTMLIVVLGALDIVLLIIAGAARQDRR
ncbi:hypothetical protein [Sphingopyxis sp. MSC1_008]|uniref:hypothetical protein n=1 Tax=Sphingopyxis sp. MSC1_008 TaxID=2909265 RepID=UPI0020BE4154|nr:hypothetical protein [Sphingopyxis sp. MSC1_008]